MAEFWTVEQAQAQAGLLAKEFSNRQILIYGNGTPNMNVPIGVEYEDRSFLPAVRYRKIGNTSSDWMKLENAEAATEQEVLDGVNDRKMVTPARLTEKLNQFSSEFLGIPTHGIEVTPSSIVVQLEQSPDPATYILILPEALTLSIASISIEALQNNSIVSHIQGGEIGQIINLKRASNFSIILNSSDQVKVSQPFVFSDSQLLDNISLQKISSSVWVELSRKKF
ncbi:MAG: hypothetical protein RJQ00_06505 [Vicingaceae bacterium]